MRPPSSLPIHYRTANMTDAEPLAHFFEYHREAIATSTENREFLCALGTRAAIRKNEILLALVGGEIIGAVRIYVRKTTPKVSVYQFAIDASYHDQDLLRNMLEHHGAKVFETTCTKEAPANDYFRSTGWIKISNNEKNNIWQLSF